MIIYEGVFHLYDDPSTKEKLAVMTKWEVMMDDERNPSLTEELLERMFIIGRKYKITIEEEI